MKAHWHDSNPWADSVIYLPIEQAAALCDYSRSVADTLAHWRQCGRTRLDAYILPQASGRHSLGVRYGADGNEYISAFANQERLAAWLAGYYTASEESNADAEAARERQAEIESAACALAADARLLLDSGLASEAHADMIQDMADALDRFERAASERAA